MFLTSKNIFQKRDLFSPWNAFTSFCLCVCEFLRHRSLRTHRHEAIERNSKHRLILGPHPMLYLNLSVSSTLSSKSQSQCQRQLWALLMAPIAWGSPCLIPDSAASPKFPLIATGLGKFVAFNLRLIIPQWHSEFFRAWRSWWSVWTAPCPTGRKNNFQAVPGRRMGSVRPFFWSKQFCWLEQDFANDYFVFQKLQLLKISEHQFYIYPCCCCFFFFF